MVPIKLVRGGGPRRCPECDSGTLMRSHRRGVLGLPVLRRLGLSFYRCSDCWHRFIMPVPR